MQTTTLKEIAIRALEDMKAQDITIIDVRKKTSITDYMLITTGTSDRHIKSISDNVIKEVKKNNKVPSRLATDGDIWEAMKGCFDPEIPVNIVDLGLVYDLVTKQLKNNKYYVNN